MPASYMLLDGYNVIGAVERYRTRNTGGLAESRELLLADCLKAAGWTGAKIVVVFDAHRGQEPEREEYRAGRVLRVIFSAPGHSADDVIERLLGRLDGEATVYTGDFALQRTALARGASRATPREFEKLLDELPAVTRAPNRIVRSQVRDRLPKEVVRKLDELRRAGE
ncbi:putative RNA-binding protein containing a PIN domain [Rubrobacter radiotolerans]|uniref:NYN domain-containing protein n=1 Tax=Rubrobacter radiotolerans TaxID=42256 RepID=A0A023X4U3_RUBRA|nr:NYN domain-containing protein [Rubrobacter radiotolerans]AHY47241.1 putative RNA-binding protein containing a PIN domain [Rubrobacter radiotolerans]MDX5894645.1 NYN domain-containing protein [Rubrobacter radiotolerans]SMC06461.1 hypothetical protein SAMN00767673_1961 [Rubrobacter radiotolerans DSM 5868]